MFINKDSLIINGVNMGQYITEVEYGYNKLWAKDSGRNLAGTQSGTLINCTYIRQSNSKCYLL